MSVYENVHGQQMRWNVQHGMAVGNCVVFGLYARTSARVRIYLGACSQVVCVCVLLHRRYYQ